MRTRIIKTLLFALIFGTLSGLMIAVMLGIFVPEFYTQWAGSLVCPGKVEYLTLSRGYYCYTSPTEYFKLGDEMFWAVFKRFVFPALMIGFLSIIGFIKLGEYLWKHRAAAGF